MSWRWREFDYYRYFPVSTPRKAKGGIKAQSQRGAFGQSWWAKRWVAVLESFNIGQRLARGRSYARSGQVLSIVIKKGTVTAEVQGSRAVPYSITIKVKAITAANWMKLAKNVSRQALFAAKLLAGEMPPDIEKAFEDAGFSLFPDKLHDLKTQCSCPDWSNPCKHIAAVYYLLGEEFDRDPFLIFKLRGMSREEFIRLLAGSGKKSRREEPAAKPIATTAPAETVASPEPLSLDPSQFWQGRALPGDFFGEVRTPGVQAALPRRLGSFPFWRGSERFLEAIEPIYKGASSRGVEVFLGEGGIRLNRRSR
jgi:uncharacterized Zn finger protein